MGKEALVLEERTIGVVPRVRLNTSLGHRDYAILVTNLRSIFVLEFVDRMRLALYGGLLVAVGVKALEGGRMTYDYAAVYPSQLAKLKKSIVVHHDLIERLRFKSGLLAGSMKIAYQMPSGSRMRFTFELVPPKSFKRKLAMKGKGGWGTSREYLMQVQDIYKKALLLPFCRRAKVAWQDC